MQKPQELVNLYKNFRKFTNEAGGYFRSKDDYSGAEKIDFILAFYRSFSLLMGFFESDEELKSGKSVIITEKGEIGRVSLTIKLIQEEFDTTVSVIYFNLSAQDIEKMFSLCKDNSMLREQAVLKRLFVKFLQV